MKRGFQFQKESFLLARPLVLMFLLMALLELPHGNCAGLILRYDNALCFLVPLLSPSHTMPHIAYFIIPWNESHDRGSH